MAYETPRCDVSSEFAKEVYAVMREKEHRISCFNHPKKSPYPENYSILAEYVIRICEEFELSTTTTFRACILMHRVFMCPLINVESQKPAFQLVALNCVSLAAKFEETPEAQPKVEELLDAADGQYDENVFKEAERFVLDYLNWEINDVTPACFSHYFLSRCSPEHVNVDHEVKKLVVLLLGLSLQDYSFVGWLPSMLSASALKAARVLLKEQLGTGNLLEEWGDEMVNLTGYKASDLAPCCSRLLQKYRTFTDANLQNAAANSSITS